MGKILGTIRERLRYPEASPEGARSTGYGNPGRDRGNRLQERRASGLQPGGRRNHPGPSLCLRQPARQVHLGRRAPVLHPQDSHRAEGSVPRPPRQFDGLLGFPCQAESEHDAFNTGHASTALSAALGMAVARDKKKEDFNVIAVVGDGSLTGGVALEALNQIGHLREKMIIVLNYNEMSISPNVGAISRYLSYLVSGQHYLKIKDQAKSILKSIPKVGWPLIKIGRAAEELVKKTFFPGLFFEELGIRYIGPVQGHSLGSLIEVFELAKKYEGPIMLHCVTQKGRGYAPAQNNPQRFHGAGPFNIATGESLSREKAPSYSEVFGQAVSPSRGRCQDPGHHGGHDRGDGASRVRREVSGAVLRRRHRRTARGDLRRRAGGFRLQARRGHLFDFSPAGLRPGLPRHLSPGSPRHLRPGPVRYRPRRRPDPPGHQ